MQNFQDTFDSPKRSFISGFSIYVTVPLIVYKLTELSHSFSKHIIHTCQLPQESRPQDRYLKTVFKKILFRKKIEKRNEIISEQLFEHAILEINSIGEYNFF